MQQIKNLHQLGSVKDYVERFNQLVFRIPHMIEEEKYQRSSMASTL